MINHVPLLAMIFGTILLVLYFFLQNQRQVLLVALAAILLTARTANLGGKISHPELRDSKDKNQQQINSEKNEKEND